MICETLVFSRCGSIISMFEPTELGQKKTCFGPGFGASDKVQFKPACTAKGLEIREIILSGQQNTMVLISLHGSTTNQCLCFLHMQKGFLVIQLNYKPVTITVKKETITTIKIL